MTRGCEIAFGMPEHLRKPPKDLTDDQRAALLQEAAAWRANHVWSPHQLRHSAATEIRHKHGLEAAQVVLGHSRINVTEIYAEKNRGLAERVVREVG